MNQITRMCQILQPQLGWHGARIVFLASFLMALFRVKTVNLAEVATGFPGKAKTQSHYKRLQRFFREFELDYGQLAILVVEWLDIPYPWVLAVDRTTWEMGSCVVNILMLGVVHTGVAIPLLWWMLDQKGNSNTEERVDLLEEFCQLFPEAEVAYLSADREFLGKNWFTYLLQQALIEFRIRIRESDKLDNGHKSLQAAVVFSSLQVNEHQVLRRPRQVWGCWVYVAATRLDDRSLLIVVSSQPANRAIADDAHRWLIETLFGIFKTRGFCLESTHLREPERLSKLLSLLTIALCWALQTGEWLVEQMPIEMKKHGRRAKSAFRTGFDHLRRVLLNLDQSAVEFSQALSFLSCT